MKGASIVIVGVIYTWQESKHFGNNWTATSPEEFVCDGIGVIIVALGLLLMEMERGAKRKGKD